MTALWLPRTRSRSPGHSARSSTRRSSRQASGWATVDQVNRRFAGRRRRGRPRGPQNFARRPRGTRRPAHRPPRPFGVSDLAAVLATPPAAAVPGAASSPTMWPPSGADRCGDHAFSVSPNTRRAYAGALRRLDAWLDGRDRELDTRRWPPTSPSCTTRAAPPRAPRWRPPRRASARSSPSSPLPPASGRPGCSLATGGRPAIAAAVRRGRSGSLTWRPCSPPVTGRGGAGWALSPRRSPSSAGASMR